MAEPDLAGVLDKLQQVRAIDPAAEQKLLAELRRTPAASWPLVAEQFRASLAYHEQLAAAEQRNHQEDEARAEPLGIAPQLGSAGTPPSQQPLVSAADRPSAPIGTLVDPRSADADGVSSEALARSTPYSAAASIAQRDAATVQPDHGAPAEFSTAGTMQPIASQSTPAVIQASLNVNGEPSSGGQIAEPSGADPSPGAQTADSDDNWQQLVAKAADRLNDHVAESPASTAEVHQHVSLRILRLLEGNTEKALEPIPHIAPVEQQYWSRQLFALATYLDHHSQPDDKRRAAASVTHLDEAVANLREISSLSLRNLSFCKNVYGYGAIEPYDNDQFSPSQQVSLYVEVENYHSPSTEKGFCTSLGSTYEIVNEDGNRMDGGEFPDVEDCCLSRRRDFHIQFGLTLPGKLMPGLYQLQLVVKDRQSDKIGHATAAFEIRGTRR